MSTDTEPQKTKPSGSMGFFARIGVSPIAFLVTCIISIVFLPTFLLLLGGMLPSVLAFILDDTARKSKSKAISYLNLSGCIIVGLDLWTGGNSIDDALNIFFQPVNWVIMYGMAMFGWILIRSLDPFITSYLRLTYQVQQKNLRKRRKFLLNEWGENVTVVSKDGEFVYDSNVYLDEDEVVADPDESIDQIPDEEHEEPMALEDHSTENRDSQK